MFRKIILSVVLLSVLSFNCYAEEEEEELIQTRPSPIERTGARAVMQKNKAIQTRSRASAVSVSKRQRLSEEEEELQAKPAVHSNTKLQKQIKKGQQQKAKIGVMSR